MNIFSILKYFSRNFKTIKKWLYVTNCEEKLNLSYEDSANQKGSERTFYMCWVVGENKEQCACSCWAGESLSLENNLAVSRKAL